MPEAGEIFGKYHLVRRVGEGGMGCVWEGIHPGIERRVAIKILHPEHARQQVLVERFFNEARAVNRIHHPSLVQVSDCGQLADGTTYIVMEFLDGQNLRERIETGGQLPLSVAVRISRQIASAMSAAHRVGIIHRDLKPENVMLVPDPAMPDGERVKLLDFGIAKLSADDHGPRTQIGSILGTPHYMSPEQWYGSGRINTASDVFSLGVMLYEMITERRPFEGETPFSVAHKAQQEDPVRLHKMRSEISDRLSDWVHSMLRKDPAQRPSMQEVYEALEEFERPDGNGVTSFHSDRAQPMLASPAQDQMPTLEGAAQHEPFGLLGRVVEFFRSSPPKPMVDLFSPAAASAIPFWDEQTLIRPSPAVVQQMTTVIKNPAEPAAPTDEVLAKSEQIGNFRIVRTLGQSSIGVMYEGEKLDTGKRAAIRVLDFKSSADPKAIERFMNTARKVSALGHPAIVPVLEFGRPWPDAALAYIATEFVEGDTLRSHLTNSGQMSESDTITVLRPIVTALVLAHKKGIVHCDLRPEKIMLVFRLEEPRVYLPERGRSTVHLTSILEGRLLDFGMAQILPLPVPDLDAVEDAVQESTHSVVYFPPERIVRWGELPDDLRKGDVYMLGMVVYEMLGGRAPLHETGETDITTRVQRVLFDKPPPLATIAKGTSRSLSDLAQRMVDKTPAKRPTMAEVEQVLSEIWREAQRSSAQPVRDYQPTHDVALPAGIRQLALIEGHFTCLAWSPNGKLLATGGKDRCVRLFSPEDGAVQAEYPHRAGRVMGLVWSARDAWLVAYGRRQIEVLDRASDTWYALASPTNQITSACGSPDGNQLAVGDELGQVLLYEVRPDVSGQTLAHAPPGHPAAMIRTNQGISSLAWSADGRLLAAGSNNGMIRVFAMPNGELTCTFAEHQGGVVCLTFAADSKRLVSGSRDKTVRVWDCERGLTDYRIDSHFETVTAVAFATQGRLLVTQARDNFVRLWLSGTYEPVTEMTDDDLDYFDGTLAVDPGGQVLATISERESLIALWALDAEQLLQARLPAVHYKNARVVLVGEQRVGKTGLGRALTGQPYAVTEPTHGRHVWPMHVDVAPLPDERTQQREILLWDLAGQDGYRLVHQLHLREVDVALVVFDAQSEKEVLSSIYYWARAIRHAQRTRPENMPPAKLILVAAKCDLGRARLSAGRILSLCKEIGFCNQFETSAAENIQIRELGDAIRSAIQWDALPEIVSTEGFQRVKEFLMAEKNALRVIATCEDLYTSYLQHRSGGGILRGSYARFIGCIERLEACGLLRRLGFGGYVLLQPELIDKYASALVNFVQGDGCISEQDVYQRKFLVPHGDVLTNPDHEQLLLRVVVGDLLQAEVAIRVSSGDSGFLVFPSQVTNECAFLPRSGRAPVCFEICGALHNLYAALIVRLIACKEFTPHGFYKNAAAFSEPSGGHCGLVLRENQGGQGYIELFFQGEVPASTRSSFEECVSCYLSQQIAPEPLRLTRVFACLEPQCDEQPLDSEVVRKRLERKLDYAPCPLCGKPVTIAETGADCSPITASRQAALVRVADLQLERQNIDTLLRAKEVTKDFDILLCYRAMDRLRVLRLKQRLEERRILCVLQPLNEYQELDPGILLRVRALVICSDKADPVSWWEQHPELSLMAKLMETRQRPVVEISLSDYRPRGRAVTLGTLAGPDDSAVDLLIRHLEERERSALATVPNALLRQIISDVLTSDAEFDAFVIDHFGAVYKRFSDGMDRMRKVNLLLLHTPPRDLLFALRSCWSPPIAQRWAAVLTDSVAA